MAAKITLIKNSRRRETLSLMEMQKVANLICSEEYASRIIKDTLIAGKIKEETENQSRNIASNRLIHKDLLDVIVTCLYGKFTLS